MNEKEENSNVNSLDSFMEIKISKKEPTINNANNSYVNSMENNQNTSSLNLSNNHNNNSENLNSISDINQKQRRHRRGKYVVESRDYKCNECHKTYLSSSALKNHKRMKHNYDKENANKGRGRPKKEFEEKIYLSKMNKKYNKFLDQEKKGYEYIISFTELENIFTLLFNNYKNDIFTTSDKIEKNPFYSLLKENWEKEVPNLDKESYNSMLNCIPPVLLVNKPPIDVVFFKYLKYATKIFDKEYFLFVFKFIILFRQYVNLEKKASVNIKYVKSNKREYTQLYDASIIPDFFNDFIVNFMENRNYFDLNKDKVFNLIEYFCYWLFLEGYTDSHISKTD